ncbi:AAA family ATPase [candidate division KSB1 bacterium]|nr:AAA family ATPase [candidate division KSB1 bacterium]
MIHLKAVHLKSSLRQKDSYPFNLRLIRELDRLEFNSPVTFFVGENGSGKSTLIETIAAGVSLPVIGGERIENDITLKPARELSRHFRFVWTKNPHKGFFLRAEDFFRFARKMTELKQEMEDTASEFEGKFAGYGLQLARGAVMGQKAGLVERYGEDLNANSHGESFLTLFQGRFVPGGLYLMDEPEAPLSPLRQLSLISLLKEMTQEGDSQFIIATHSPILMAFPGATILSFDKCPLEPVDYNSLEHVSLTRDFLANPENFLRHL